MQRAYPRKYSDRQNTKNSLAPEHQSNEGMNGDTFRNKNDVNLEEKSLPSGYANTKIPSKVQSLSPIEKVRRNLFLDKTSIEKPSQKLHGQSPGIVEQVPSMQVNLQEKSLPSVHVDTPVPSTVQCYLSQKKNVRRNLLQDETSNDKPSQEPRGRSPGPSMQVNLEDKSHRSGYVDTPVPSKVQCYLSPPKNVRRNLFQDETSDEIPSQEPRGRSLNIVQKSPSIEVNLEDKSHPSGCVDTPVPSKVQSPIERVGRNPFHDQTFNEKPSQKLRGRSLDIVEEISSRKVYLEEKSLPSGYADTPIPSKVQYLSPIEKVRRNLFHGQTYDEKSSQEPRGRSSGIIEDGLSRNVQAKGMTREHRAYLLLSSSPDRSRGRSLLRSTRHRGIKSPNVNAKEIVRFQSNQEVYERSAVSSGVEDRSSEAQVEGMTREKLAYLLLSSSPDRSRGRSLLRSPRHRRIESPNINVKDRLRFQSNKEIYEKSAISSAGENRSSEDESDGLMPGCVNQAWPSIRTGLSRGQYVTLPRRRRRIPPNKSNSNVAHWVDQTEESRKKNGHSYFEIMEFQEGTNDKITPSGTPRPSRRRPSTTTSESHLLHLNSVQIKEAITELTSMMLPNLSCQGTPPKMDSERESVQAENCQPFIQENYAVPSSSKTKSRVHSISLPVCSARRNKPHSGNTIPCEREKVYEGDEPSNYFRCRCPECVAKDMKDNLSIAIDSIRGFLNSHSSVPMSTLVLQETANMAHSIRLLAVLRKGAQNVTETLLLECAEKNNYSDIRTLADTVNLTLIPDAVLDAVLIAAEQGHVLVLQELKKVGVNLCGSNAFGETALHRAARAGNSEVVEMLLANGADVMARDWFNHSPLHDAARMGQDEVMHQLLDAGADINTENCVGETPQQLFNMWSFWK